jgi:hypothetical protein
MEITPFPIYNPSLPLSPDQKRFYAFWRKAWDAGERIPVGGNAGYLYEYLFRSIQSPEDVHPRVAKVLAAYGHENEPFAWQCQKWLSHHCLWAGNYEGATANFPPFALGKVYTHAANEFLNLRRLTGSHVSAVELLALVGPLLTHWSREFLPLVSQEFESALTQMQAASGVSLVMEWSRGENRYGWHLFNGLPSRVVSRMDKPFYCYYDDKAVVGFVNGQVREAENRARMAAGIPRIGEGWVTETTLYYQIKAALPELEVIQHAQPTWLGRQHFDIFIPELGVAIEFQGPQHDRPVEFFGGEAQFEETRRRDRIKQQKCLKMKVTLIYLREGYVLEQVIQQIRDIAAEQTVTRLDE